MIAGTLRPNGSARSGCMELIIGKTAERTILGYNQNSVSGFNPMVSLDIPNRYALTRIFYFLVIVTIFLSIHKILNPKNLLHKGFYIYTIKD